MLSPCIRQVTHALLTRPPLTYKSLGFIISPFDLHVLSTPPAFILSQDQTLMLISLSWSKLTLANFFLFYCFWVESLLRFVFLFSEQFLLEFSGLHYCLFVKVLSSYLEVVASAVSFATKMSISLPIYIVNTIFYFFLHFSCFYFSTKKMLQKH